MPKSSNQANPTDWLSNLGKIRKKLETAYFPVLCRAISVYFWWKWTLSIKNTVSINSINTKTSSACIHKMFTSSKLLRCLKHCPQPCPQLESTYNFHFLDAVWSYVTLYTNSSLKMFQPWAKNGKCSVGYKREHKLTYALLESKEQNPQRIRSPKQ